MHRMRRTPRIRRIARACRHKLLNGCDDHGAISTTVDLNVFSMDTVKSACYLLAGIASAELSKATSESVLITFAFNADHLSSRQLLDRFRNVLVDSDIRERIGRETEPLRNLIIAHALSRVPLLNADEEVSELP